MSEMFSINSDVKFEWIPGAGNELMRSDGVGREIRKHTDNAFRNVNASTNGGVKYPNMDNENYYEYVYIGGARNLWRGRIYAGNIASMKHNLKSNSLAKCLNGA